MAFSASSLSGGINSKCTSLEDNPEPRSLARAEPGCGRLHNLAVADQAGVRRIARRGVVLGTVFLVWLINWAVNSLIDAGIKATREQPSG